MAIGEEKSMRKIMLVEDNLVAVRWIKQHIKNMDSQSGAYKSAFGWLFFAGIIAQIY